eukprot:699182-Pelagomonas_calceolata.AAC.2
MLVCMLACTQLQLRTRMPMPHIKPQSFLHARFHRRLAAAAAVHFVGQVHCDVEKGQSRPARNTRNEMLVRADTNFL